MRRSWIDSRWVPSLLVVVPPALVLAACGGSDYGQTAPPPEIGPSAAYGIWTPGPGDTCTKAIHDQYSVVGPDGKRYPTWHPPVDPVTGCSFGHEHGRDPRGSKLYAQVGPIPLGLANEALDTWDPQGIRHEDHFGHKIEWENDIDFNVNGVGGVIFVIKCDVMAKLHQGTHSKDAFTNNLHELVYHAKCSDGTEMHITAMAAIGTPGEFVRSCDGQHIVVGTPSPANSPSGGGQRIIPDRTCFDQIKVPAGQNSNFGEIRESWQTSLNIRRDDGHTLAGVNPYFQVVDPSRFYDPALPNITGRPVDVCFELDSSGNQVRGGMCDEATAHGTRSSVAFDDPTSGWRGAHHFMDVNDNTVDNPDGPTVWYTDPFGHHGRPAPFPGSVRQYVSKASTPINANGPSIGFNRDYTGHVTHSPN